MKANNGTSPARSAAAVAAVSFALSAYALVAIVYPDTHALGFSYAAVTAVLVGSLYALRRRLSQAFMSPVVINAVGLLAMAILGSAFFADVQDARFGASATILLSPAQTVSTFWLMAVSAMSLVAGAAVTLLILPRVAAPISVGIGAGKSLNNVLLAGCAILLTIQLVAGGSALWYRSLYIEDAVSDGGVLGIISQLAIGGIIALGYLAVSGGPMLRVSAVVITTGYLLVFFGSGSRRLAMVPILFAVGVALAKRGKKIAPVLTIAAVIAFFMLRLPLYLRSLPLHGVIPYLEMLPGVVGYEATWQSVAKNLLVSFGIIGATAYQQPPILSDIFWVSINPAPGSWVGWYDAADFLRINPYTPYAAVGELGNYGTGYVVAYFFFVGVTLALLDRTINRLMAHGRGLLGLAILGLSGLFLLYSFQYNLRSSTRMLVYGLIAAFALRLVDRWLTKRAMRGIPRPQTRPALTRSGPSHRAPVESPASYRSKLRSYPRPRSY